VIVAALSRGGAADATVSSLESRATEAPRATPRASDHGQPPVRPPGTPAALDLAARRVKPVAFSAFLHVAQHQGHPLTPRHLATLLEGFQVKAKQIRQGLDTRKGYLRADFTDAFRRYLPAPPPALLRRRCLPPDWHPGAR